MTVRVSEGTTNAHTEWVLATQGSITPDTTPLQFWQTTNTILENGNFIFSGSSRSAGDIFSISNFLGDGQSDDPNAYLAASLAGYGGICTGVHGRHGNGSATPPDVGAGIYGDSDNGVGVYGSSLTSVGMVGVSKTGDGVRGFSAGTNRSGVWGDNTGGGVGVAGSSDGGIGVSGINQNGSTAGVYGQSGSAGLGWTNDITAGVIGASVDKIGVLGLSDNKDGVRGISTSQFNSGVSAANSAPSNQTVPSGAAIWAQSNNTGIMAQGSPAGYFAGDILVTGDVVLVNPGSGDIAEDFYVDDQQINSEPGTILVINANGRLCAADAPYDTRVAGVVSGAGDLRPAVVLQRISSAIPRSPIALLGKAFCKVDAAFGSIAAGDLLTTSATPGHAMKVSDKSRALGAIIGKALACLENGVGLIPIMVSLR